MLFDTAFWTEDDMHLISLWLEFRSGKAVVLFLVHSLLPLASAATRGSLRDVELIFRLKGPVCCRCPWCEDVEVDLGRKGSTGFGPDESLAHSVGAK